MINGFPIRTRCTLGLCRVEWARLRPCKYVELEVICRSVANLSHVTHLDRRWFDSLCFDQLRVLVEIVKGRLDVLGTLMGFLIRLLFSSAVPNFSFQSSFRCLVLSGSRPSIAKFQGQNS
jgi:hypothetical protein